ncbi:prepilin peptidase [Citrobacter arsenatis]|uniref:prepilin peptidase n=1 Tax=Citrobacter arsenatis TaxID=2546350 RepID=UPI00300E514E
MSDVITSFYFWFYLALVTVVGACVGSFLNVVIYRIPLSFTCNGGSVSIVFPPSHCPFCKQNISYKDNIPLMSYVLLKGQCRFCHEKISFFYPLTEAITLIAFVCFYLIFFDKDVLLFLLTSFLFCFLYVISIIDFRYYIIPDKLLIILFIGGVLYSCVYGNVLFDMCGFVIYSLIFAIIIFACESFSDRKVLGMGDVKFYLSAVPWIGGLFFPYVMLISSLVGLFVVLFWKIYVKNFFVSNELTFGVDENRFVPFGPAIGVAFFVVYLAKYFYL